MFTRTLAAAGIVVALAVFGSGPASAQDPSCEFQFKFHNPVRLAVACEENWTNHAGCFVQPHGHVKVYTNACTRVTWRTTEFLRQETDCDGNRLPYYDRIPSELCVGFQEGPEYGQGPLCPDGAPLAIHDDPAYPGVQWDPGNYVGVPYMVPNDGSVLVDSHRGGYYIAVKLSPKPEGGHETWCDDNGCYVAKTFWWVSAIPNEDCSNVPGMEAFLE